MTEQEIQVNYYPISIALAQPVSEPQANNKAVAVSDSNVIPSANGSIVQGGTIQSPNYVKNSSGWRIDSDGTAEFQSVVAGSYITVFRQDGIPTSQHVNDIWIDTNDSNKMYIALKVGATTIAAGEWVLSTSDAAWSTLVDDDGHKPDNDATVGAIFGTNVTGGGSANTQISNAGYATLYRQGTFGNGSDGDVTISVDTTLTSDMNYDDLTINNGIILTTAGYRIYIKGTLTCTGTGKIANSGGAGGNGDNATVAGPGNGGTAGTVAAGGSLPAGEDGKAGGNGGLYSGNGGNGTAGDATTKALCGAGKEGGAGQSYTPRTGGTKGAAGATTGTIYNYPYGAVTATYLLDTQPTVATLNISGGSGSGGGGAGTGSSDQHGGGGGGSGASGGCVWVAAKTIADGLTIEAKGGNGGDGGYGYLTGDQSGGGAGAGNGGVIILIYETKGTSTLTVTGGTGGHGGFDSGDNGATGKTYSIQV